MQEYTAVEKDEVTLDCELSKDVPVKWFHNEIEIKASKMVSMKVEGKRRILHIKKVEQKDKGVYACDCGTDKTSANVNIEGEVLNYLQFGSLASFKFGIPLNTDFSISARDVKVMRPMYGVEVFDGETARFEVEISEDDIHGQWKLNGEVLTPSAVSMTFSYVRPSKLFFILCVNISV